MTDKNAMLVHDLNMLCTYVFDYGIVEVDVDDHIVAPFFDLLHKKCDAIDEMAFFEVDDFVIAEFGADGNSINALFCNGELVDFTEPCMISTLQLVLLMRGIQRNFFVGAETILNLKMDNIGNLCAQLPNVERDFLSSWLECYEVSNRLNKYIEALEAPYFGIKS